MGQALYRKYRPKTVAEVVGQEHITDTLSHALKTGKLAHAYLFTGPRGVGKTSIARILAHEINNLPYTDDSIHMDIIEIDAASNRRIDEIRELRDKVNIAPSSAKYKVYIIDEVHMLTREAFNALLKTLEEPPAHVVFILATTESHKLPETIISRTQRFMFKPVDLEKVAAHLRSLADAEKLKIDDEALKLIAAHGEGSFRDSISLLDQTRGYIGSGSGSGSGTVDGDYVRSLIGLPTDEAVAGLRQAIIDHDAARTVDTLSQLRDKGFGAPQVAKHLGKRLRQDIIQGQQPAALQDVFGLLQKLLDVPAAHDPDTYLELVLLEYALADSLQAKIAFADTAITTTTAPTAPPKPVGPITPATPAGMTSQAPAPQKPPSPPAATATPPAADSKPPSTSPARTNTTPEPAPAAPAENPTTAQPLDANNWPKVLDRLKKTHNTLYGIARMARPEFQPTMLILHFKFAFHQKRLAEAKNRDTIMAAMQQETGMTVGLKCQLEDKDTSASAGQAVSGSGIGPATAPANAGAQPMPADKGDDPLAAISNIFAGAEVIEA